MRESELKSLIKEVVRECVKERCGGHLAGGKKGQRMFKHVQAGYKGEKDPEDAKKIAAATVNKQFGEAGLTSEEGKEHGYDESEEVKLIKGLGLIVKKLISMHSGEEQQEEAVNEKKDKKWIQKAVDPKHKGYCTPMTKKTCTPARKALAKRFKKGLEEIKQECEMYLYEAGPQYKVASPMQARVQSDDHARTVQSDPQVTEASYKQVSSNETDTAKENKPLRIQTEPKVTESNHKVQARSQKTVKDLDNNPKNVRDPEVPQA